MFDNDLTDIFDDCLNRLAAGESVEQCLRRYAAYDATLRPLLQTVRLTQRALPAQEEVSRAQARGRALLTAALAEPVAKPRVLTPRWLMAVAALLLVGFGIGAVTLNSLPSDPLYGLKRRVEDGVIALSADSNAAIESARQRRIDEIYLLIALGRPAAVEFSGDVEAITADAWRVSGLSVSLSPETAFAAEIAVGDRVTVAADVTFERTLVAREIRLTQPVQPEATPEPAAVTLTPTLTATATLAATLTSTTFLTETATPLPTEAATRTPSPSLTPTDAPTDTSTPTIPAPSPTDTPVFVQPLVVATTTPAVTAASTLFFAPTWTPPPSRTPSPTPAETSLPAQRDNCTTLRPASWVTYTVRSGDSLFGLASATGTSISMIMQLNCLPESGLILVNQPLYLPLIPPTRPPSVAVPPAANNPPLANVQPAPIGGDNSSGSRDTGSSGGGDNSSDDSGGDDSSG